MSLNAIPTRLNFGSVMNAAAEAGDVEFMETLFSRVDEFGINVNTHILQIKIKAYLKGNNPEAAVDTLRSMRDNADENLWPNARCYYTILDHFRTHNIPTTQIEEWMKEDQVEPEAPNLSSDIGSYWHFGLSPYSTWNQYLTIKFALSLSFLYQFCSPFAAKEGDTPRDGEAPAHPRVPARLGPSCVRCHTPTPRKAARLGERRPNFEAALR